VRRRNESHRKNNPAPSDVRSSADDHQRPDAPYRPPEKTTGQLSDDGNVPAPANTDRRILSSSVKDTLQGITYFLAPGTLIVAILYYFGWARTHALYEYFGIDVDILGFSTSDYVMRSADALWPPLAAILVVALLSLFVHTLIFGWAERGQRRRQLKILAWTLLGLGVGLCLRGLLGVVNPSWQDFEITPMSLAVGSGLIGYGMLLRRRIQTLWPLKAGIAPTSSPSRVTIAVSGLLIGIIVLNLFWATAVLAEALGRGRAQRLEANAFTTTPDVIVYSKTRLYLDARDIIETDLGASYAPYRFRYEGFKLLVRSRGTLLLIPYSWSTSNAFTLVLPENDSVRIEFAPNF